MGVGGGAVKGVKPKARKEGMRWFVQGTMYSMWVLIAQAKGQLLEERTCAGMPNHTLQ